MYLTPINSYYPLQNFQPVQYHNFINNPQSTVYYPVNYPKPQRVINAENRLSYITNPLNVKNEYRKNPEYQKLCKKEYFNTYSGEKNLLNIIYNLEFTKNRTIIDNFYNPNTFFDGGMNKKFEEADINKCLNNINKVLDNNKLSKAVKDYVIVNAGNLRFQIIALNALDNIESNDEKQIEKLILNPLSYMYF